MKKDRKKPTKRTQDRTEVTRQKLQSAARELFCSKGYDGVTLSDVEKLAGVHRGLVAYHFDDKASLWREVASDTFGHMRMAVDERLAILKEVSPQEHLAMIVRFYVRYSANHPETSALVSQEARTDSWRIQYLIDNHIKPACDAMEQLAASTLGLDRQGFIHWYYILISASSTIFYFAPECKLLFGIESRDEAIIERHAELLVDMLVKKPAIFTEAGDTKA